MEAVVGILFAILFISVVVALFIAFFMILFYVSIVAIPVSLLTHYLLRHLVRGNLLATADLLIALACGALGLALIWQLQEPETWIGMACLVVCAMYIRFASKDRIAVPA